LSAGPLISVEGQAKPAEQPEEGALQKKEEATGCRRLFSSFFGLLAVAGTGLAAAQWLL
jgi:hypothetical protein